MASAAICSQVIAHYCLLHKCVQKHVREQPRFRDAIYSTFHSQFAGKKCRFYRFQKYLPCRYWDSHSICRMLIWGSVIFPMMGGTVYWAFIAIRYKLAADKKLLKKIKCKAQVFNRTKKRRISKLENRAVSTDGFPTRDNGFNCTKESAAQRGNWSGFARWTTGSGI